jgi:hypothetical protein
MDPLLWHVPGLSLVSEGIDGASRGGDYFGEDANLESVLGPAITDDFWRLIQDALADIGWRITVDLFATQSNRRAERFCSRYGEPGTEAIDALSSLDWGQSRCPRCGGLHREVAYAFPPTGLIRHTVRKATADAALIVLVVPVAITAPHWHKLVACSVLEREPAVDGFIRVRNPQRVLNHAMGYMPKELAVFACDFSRWNARADLAGVTTCAGAYQARRRPLCGSEADQEDRRRLREALLAQRDERLTGEHGR